MVAGALMHLLRRCAWMTMYPKQMEEQDRLPLGDSEQLSVSSKGAHVEPGLSRGVPATALLQGTGSQPASQAVSKEFLPAFSRLA